MASLNDRIKTAKSESEVNKLLAEGKGYQWAKRKTRNKWERTAKKTLQPKPVS
jgi:hypothetical protein